MINKIKSMILVISLICLVSCGGGSSEGGGVNNPEAADLSQISVSSISEYPANIQGQTFVTVTNNTNNIISGLTYSLSAAGSNVTIDATSASNCAKLSARQSCNIRILFNDNKASAGVVSLLINGTNATSLANVKAAVSTKQAGVGLVNIANNNQQSGASGVVILAPDTVTQNSNGLTPVIVTVVVNSANIGDVDTFTLVDTVSHKPLSFASTLSGNNGGTNFSKGETVSFLLNVPDGINQVAFQLQASKNSTSNISYSYYPTVINLVNNKAVVSLVPSHFSLAGNAQSQQVYAINTGDTAATNLKLPSITLNDGKIINVSSGNTAACGSSLASGSYCSYTVSFNTSQTVVPGSAILNLSYNNGTSAANSFATINYSGITNPDIGLLSVTSSTNKFNATTASPTVSSNLLLANTSTSSYIESEITFTLPQYFSLVSSGNANACSISGGNKVTTVLQQGESCSVSLVYTNSNVTPSSLANLNISYNYTDGITLNNIALNPIGLIYSTSQSSAVLSFASQTVVFANIVSNNSDSTTQAIQLINNGQVTANNLKFTLNDNILSSYTVVGNNCGNSLSAGASCSVNVKFGPTLLAKTYDNKLIASYTDTGNQTQQTTTNLVGTAIEADEADLVISGIAANQSVAGDGKTSTTSFQFQQPDNNQLVLTYKNIGKTTANSISIDTSTLANGFSVVSNNCSGNLAVGNTCIVSLRVPLASGANNLPLNSLSASWRDAAGQHNSQDVYWQDTITPSRMYSIVYVNVFEIAHIVLSSDVSLSSAIPGASFNLQVTLVGGYQVPNTAVTLSGAGVNINPANCTLSSNNSSCEVVVSTSPTQSVGNYTVSATSVQGNASFPFTLHTGKVIYLTRSRYASNLMALNNSANGIAGADYACGSDIGLPNNDFTFKAMIVDGVNRSISRSAKIDWVLEPNTAYVRSDYLTPIGMTNESATFYFPLENSIGPISSEVWTGLLAGWSVSHETCNEWTGTGAVGAAGNSGSTLQQAIIGRVSCTISARLYCVQQ